MTTHNISGNLLYVTVISGNKLKNTEWISRQDPYVCIEYGGNKFQTRTCTDGGKNPSFQERFVYTLIEGLRELNVDVLNHNIVKHDDFIGSGKVPLAKALLKGYDDSAWPLQSRTGRHAGEVRLIMEYCIVNQTTNNHVPVVQPQPPRYGAPPAVLYPLPTVGFQYPPAGSAYPAPAPAPAPYPTYPSYPPDYYQYPSQPAPYSTQPPYPPNPSYPQGPHTAPYDAQPGPSNPVYPQPHESYHPLEAIMR